MGNILFLDVEHVLIFFSLLEDFKNPLVIAVNLTVSREFYMALLERKTEIIKFLKDLTSKPFYCILI